MIVSFQFLQLEILAGESKQFLPQLHVISVMKISFIFQFLDLELRLIQLVSHWLTIVHFFFQIVFSFFENFQFFSLFFNFKIHFLNSLALSSILHSQVVHLLLQFPNLLNLVVVLGVMDCYSLLFIRLRFSQQSRISPQLFLYEVELFQKVLIQYQSLFSPTLYLLLTMNFSSMGCPLLSLFEMTILQLVRRQWSRCYSIIPYKVFWVSFVYSNGLSLLSLLHIVARTRLQLVAIIIPSDHFLSLLFHKLLIKRQKSKSTFS